MNEQQELHDSVVAWVSRINESWQGTVRNIVETGKALIDAKADLPHGAFTEMVETDLFFSTRTAQRLMAIAEHPSLSNPTHVSVLPASWGTLYELSKIDGCTVEKLIQAGRIYPELERKDISALLPPPKTKAKAKKATVITHAVDVRHPVPPVVVGGAMRELMLAYDLLFNMPANQTAVHMHRHVQGELRAACGRERAVALPAS
jgi:Protein of unknown function (DUF3102)